MLRRLHALAGLALALFLLAIASTGVILSVEPAANRLAYPTITQGTSVAVLADGVAARHVRVELDPRARRRRGDGRLQRRRREKGRVRRSPDRGRARTLRNLRVLPFRGRPAPLAAHGRRRPHHRRDRGAGHARALHYRDRAARAQPRRRLSAAQAHSRRRRTALARRTRSAGARRLAAVVADGDVPRRHDLRPHPDPGVRAAGESPRAAGRSRRSAASRRSPEPMSPTSSN